MKKILLVSSIILLLTGASYALTLSSVSSSWNDPVGNTYYVNYVNQGSTVHSEIRYGDPATNYGQSGLGFTSSATPSTFNINQAFELGTLIHYNNPTYSGTEISSVDLRLILAFSDPDGLFGDYEFDFGINNTPNNAYPDTNPANNDIITFTNAYAESTMNINGTLYTIQLLGFGDSPDSLVNQLSSIETQTNSAKLWARVTTPSEPVPEPATLILLGSGLFGLAGFRKKIRN